MPRSSKRSDRYAVKSFANDTGCFEGLGEATAAQRTEAFNKLDRKITEQMLRDAGLRPKSSRHYSKAHLG